MPSAPPLLAHPLTEGVLPVSPVLAAFLGAVLVVACALLWPSRPPVATLRPAHIHSWDGSLTRGQVATRVISVAVLVLAVVAGRVGSELELENLAPALVIGVGWPALLVLSAALGPVWRWVDPWDGLVRLVATDEEATADESRSVYLALVPALGWTWYLGVYPDALSPRSVGLVLGLYTIVTVGACLAAGRVRWLSGAEVFGILFGWLARLPRGLLREWVPPRGAALLLGTLAGGLIFGEVRRTELWGTLNVVPAAMLWVTLALAGSAALGAGVLHSTEEWGSRRGARGSVPSAALPAVAAIGLAMAMARSRLFTSVYLLPTVLVDPFGFGWDLWGSSERGVEAPLGPARLALVQVGVLLVGHVIGAIVLASREREVRGPAAVALGVSMAAATGTVLMGPGL